MPQNQTLRSGRKHRVRGQVLWNKAGQPVAVDLTTSPVRDGEQLVGAVMTFTDRRSYDALAARCERVLVVTIPLDLGRPRAGRAVEEANAVIEASGALVLDLKGFGARNLVMADHVHPTAFGQVWIAERALEVLGAP